MPEIKLKPKQLEAINAIQTEKTKLNNMFASLNEKESLILGVLLEENNITEPITSVKLEGSSIVFEYEATEKPKKLRTKLKKAE